MGTGAAGPAPQGPRSSAGQRPAAPTLCALPQGRPGMNGLKGEKGEPGDASVGFGMRVSVRWGVRGGAGASRPGGLVSGLGSQNSTLGGF